MNKTDRLLAIVLELQGRRVVRAEDLAAQFETSEIGFGRKPKKF
nr:hypothetical protein [Paenibacillus mellifer]